MGCCEGEEGGSVTEDDQGFFRGQLFGLVGPKDEVGQDESSMCSAKVAVL